MSGEELITWLAEECAFRKGMPPTDSAMILILRELYDIDAAVKTIRHTSGRSGDRRLLFGNLLARIHRAGGHYIEANGWEKACNDAEEIVLSERERAARAEEALREAQGVQTYLYGLVEASRDALAAFQKQAGWLPQQQAYSTKMTEAEFQIAKAVQDLTAALATLNSPAADTKEGAHEKES